MWNKHFAFLLNGLLVLLCVTCCASKPKIIEQTDEIEQEESVINLTEKQKIKNNADENIMEKLVINVNYSTPFDPVEFVSKLNEGMEVFKVFPDPNIEEWIGLPGKIEAKRYYFNYILPLHSKPISSNDEMMAMFHNQAKIARLLNPAYVINMDIDIRSEDSKEVEKKTLKLNIQQGTKIQDYRKEGMIKYTLKDESGKFKYGAYIVASAIVTKNDTEAERFNALQEWLTQAEKSEIEKLFNKLFKNN